LIHEAQVQLDTTAIMAYMFIAGIVGFMMDRLVLVLEDVLLRWKRGA
jgi:ABC-type nitrate/sulfonate/bicarbonate transport system permease component